MKRSCRVHVERVSEPGDGQVAAMTTTAPESELRREEQYRVSLTFLEMGRERSESARFPG